MSAENRAVDDPVKLAQAARIFKAAMRRAEPLIQEIVSSAPPLTAEQVERLRALLPPVKNSEEP